MIVRKLFALFRCSKNISFKNGRVRWIDVWLRCQTASVREAYTVLTTSVLVIVPACPRCSLTSSNESAIHYGAACVGEICRLMSCIVTQDMNALKRPAMMADFPSSLHLGRRIQYITAISLPSNHRWASLLHNLAHHLCLCRESSLAALALAFPAQYRSFPR